MVNQELLEPLAYPGNPGDLEKLVKKDHLDLPDLKDDLECPDHLDCLVSLEREDFLVFRVCLV